MKLAAWLAALLIAAPASAQCELGSLEASPPVTYGCLGRALSVAGDLAAVGAPYEGTTGAVYVFERSGGAWTQTARLAPSDGAAYTQSGEFGTSAALSGTTLLVGARRVGSGVSAVGRAYVFERGASGWVETAILVPPPAPVPGWFGASVALAPTATGLRALVGAPISGVGKGAVYAFESAGAGWQHVQTLQPIELALASSFGEALALDGDRLVVGSPNEKATALGALSGAAYTFEWSGSAWVQQQRLLSSDPAGGQRFGAAVVLDGANLVIGAPHGDVLHFSTASDAGRAFAFQLGAAGFEQIDLLHSPDGLQGELFGSSLALDGDDLAVGVPRDMAVYSRYGGTVLRFRRVGTRWVLQSEHRRNLAGNDDLLGTSVALTADELWAGVPNANAGAAACGSVARFARTHTPCPGAPCVRAKFLAPYAPLMSVDQVGRHVEWHDDLAWVSGDTDGVHVLQDTSAGWVELTTLPVAYPDALDVEPIANGYRAAFSEAYFFIPETVWLYTGNASSWNLEATLVSPDPSPAPNVTDNFGEAIALRGEWLAVGAPSDHELGVDAVGTAFLWHNSGSGWSFHSKLMASDPQYFAQFGAHVSFDGDTLWIGAPTADDAKGALYRFDWNGAGWVQALKLSPPDVGGAFGTSFARSGNTLAVGAIWNDGDLKQHYNDGSVYLYELSSGTWNFSAKLRPLLGNPAKRCQYLLGGYGHEVALDGDRLLVGTSRGVWRYERTAPATWQYVDRICGWDDVEGGGFGAGLVLRDERLLVGSPGDGQADYGAGALYDISLDGSACATLVARTQAIGTHVGGVQDLVLRAPAASAGELRWIVGSLSGVTPATSLYGATLPLAHDYYLDLSIAQPGTLPPKPALGFLDAAATGVAQIELPGAIYMPLIGLRAHHAFVAVDLATLAITHVSNPVPLQLR